MINFAHRGASGYCPENTMVAFERAIQLGATGIETDIQMTADGKLVLIHDDTLDRTTTGTGRVGQFTYNELTKLDAGSWYSPKFAGESVPRLEELLELAVQKDVWLNLELKFGSIYYPGIEEKLIHMVKQMNYGEKVVISSFDHVALARCHELEPGILTGVLYVERLYKPWDYAASMGAKALHGSSRVMLPSDIEQAHQHGCKVNVWTVNDEQRMRDMIQAGVDGIITDVPDKLASLLTETGVND